MNKFFVVTVFVTVFGFGIIQNVKARAKITYGNYEKISKIHDLPNTDVYLSNNNQHFDLGYKFVMFEIAGLPIYQKGKGEVVGYVNDDMYVILNKEDIDYIVKENNISDLESIATPSFWNAWGGKLVLLVIFVGGFAYWFINSKKKDKDESGAVLKKTA